MANGFAIYPYGGKASDAHIPTFADIDAQLTGRIRESHKTGNNTYLQRREGGSIALKLHKTDIITWYPDGSMKLDSGGWRTMLTKQRMNNYLPRHLQIFTDKGVWYMGGSWNDKSQSKVFQDGIIIRPDGTVENAGVSDPKADKVLKAKVKAYAKLCADSFPLPYPDGGDCWFCHMKTEDGKTLGDSTHSDHISSHLEESYVVPSLVYNAMVEAGYDPGRNMQFSLVFGEENKDLHCNIRDSIRPHIQRAIYKYIMKRYGYQQ